VKTLLVTVPNGTVISSLLFTNIVSDWSKEGMRVVLMVPEHSRKALEEHFSQANVFFETLKDWRHSSWQELYILAARSSLAKRCHLKTLHLMELYNQVKSKSLWRKCVWALSPSWLWLQKLLMKKYKKNAPRFYKEVFEEYKPDLVFSNNPYMPSELPLVVTAEDLQVPLMALCHSWDNLTSRGPMPFTPQRMLSWNKVNAE